MTFSGRRATMPVTLGSRSTRDPVCHVTIRSCEWHLRQREAPQRPSTLGYFAERRRAAIASIWVISARCALTMSSQSLRSSGSVSLASRHMRMAPE